MIVAARVPDELKVKIEDLCEKEGRSVSDLIRELLNEYIREKEEEWHRVNLRVKIPRNILSQIDIFVEMGYALDRNQVITEALSLWLRIKKMEYRKNWKEELMEALSGSSNIL
ncbi:MAG: ribbon-helix-helix protein, CopG family [Thermoplasmata archaeon]|nr:ribbon-helix-helix protein, CopG family [Thermoplasmata archaeon]